MILEIKKFGDQILRKKAEEAKTITPEIKELIFNMIETVKKNQGLGLAAPQVGVLKRVIVVETEQGAAGFVNPKILKQSQEKEIGEEGCLSFPGLFLKIKRPKSAEIEALNSEGEKVRLQATGLVARIFQHEIEHLDGILIVDKISFWQRWKLRKKFKEFKNDS